MHTFIFNLTVREEQAKNYIPKITTNTKGRWYVREDGTLGFTWLQLPADLNQYLSQANLDPVRVRGNYRNYGNGTVKSTVGDVTVNNGLMDIQQASDYPHLLIFTKKHSALATANHQ